MAAKKKTAKPTRKPAKRGRPKKVEVVAAAPTRALDAEGLSSKVKRLSTALGKKFGNRVLTVREDQRALAEITEYIPTGVDVLDYHVIGRGGWPVGRMSEIFGEEGCTKTSLALHSLAQVQRMGGVAVLADAEQSFDSERAESFGVNLDDLLLLQPANLEELFEMVKGTLRLHRPSDGPMLIAWDSIASTRTKHGLISEAGEKRVADVPLMMSEELPKVLQMLPAHRAHFMMINQIRNKIGVMFGSNITTPGGNAPKFYSSVRLQYFGGKAVKKDDVHIAKILTVMAVKNRLQAPFAKARVRFDYASGYNNLYSTIEHAKSRKLITPREGKNGFSGKGKAGQEAYDEAIRKLGWPVASSVASAERSSSAFAVVDEEDDVEAAETDEDDSLDDAEEEEDEDVTDD